MKKPLIFIILGIFLVGAVAGFALMRKPSGDAKEKGGRSHKSHKKEPEQLSVMTLEEFVVNLSDVGEPHYLKASVSLEVAGDSGGEEAQKADLPKIRDVVITTMSKRNFRELLTANGKQSLKNAIKKEINHLLDDDRVSQVYFTSFAMQ